MSANPYRLIFALLIVSVLFILVLQGIWIRSFYVQKQEDFNRSVYAAMEQAGERLNERKEIRVLKNDTSFRRRITRIKTDTRRREKRVTASITKSGYGKTSYQSVITHLDASTQKMQAISVSDSVVAISAPGMSVVKTVVRQNSKPAAGTDVDKLVDKLLLELEAFEQDETNSDTIKHVLSRAFANKGLFLPFKFALKNMRGDTATLIAASRGFNDSLPYYSSNLSANKVFNTHRFLLVQFDGNKGLVLASMKNILLLSLAFSLILIGVFYYTMHLILKQKKLAEIKTDFVNNMTHELKTPIATMALALDGIHHPEVRNNAERFSDYTRILKEENRKLNRHVERVLQMALLDKGELQLHKEKISLVTVINAAIKAHALRIQQQHAIVNFLQGTDVLPVYADELHLGNVFGNLLDNSLKYSRGTCVINISIARAPTAYVISFKDNGIGIDASLKDRVFEQFYRVQGGNLHDVKGFGLGLSYVRSIVEAHGGSVALHSEKGKGTEFIITLSAHAG